LVHEDVIDDFKAEMVKVLNEFYGDVTQYNDNITHIISERHFDRLVRAIETSEGRIIAEGFRDRDRLYIGPTLIESPSVTSQLMKEEIFGPVLPIVPVSGPAEAIAFINQREKPLALYVLSDNERVWKQFVDQTSSGAAMLNDTTFHVSSPYAPFGGVGNSGMGHYHGKAGIRSCSHMKPVLAHSTFMDIGQRYPPYTDGHLRLMKAFC
jgi:acyl-CoA reductase-like NAD-dependent aldehyde dehydrogenase